MVNRTTRRKIAQEAQHENMSREMEVVPLLKELVMLNKQQINRETPQVQDAPPMLEKRNHVFTFWKSVEKGNITSSSTIETDGVFSFTLGDLPEVSSLTSVFDTYRILQIRLCFNPLAVLGPTTIYPPLTTAIDYDDANSTTQSALREYDSVMSIPTGQFFERVFTPRVAVASYATGATFTGFAQRSLQWCDCASTTIQHYGIKYALPAASAAQSLWEVNAHYVVQFRQSR